MKLDPTGRSEFAMATLEAVSILANRGVGVFGLPAEADGQSRVDDAQIEEAAERARQEFGVEEEAVIALLQSAASHIATTAAAEDETGVLERVSYNGFVLALRMQETMALRHGVAPAHGLVAFLLDGQRRRVRNTEALKAVEERKRMQAEFEAKLGAFINGVGDGDEPEASCAECGGGDCEDCERAEESKPQAVQALRSEGVGRFVPSDFGTGVPGRGGRREDN